MASWDDDDWSADEAETSKKPEPAEAWDDEDDEEDLKFKEDKVEEEPPPKPAAKSSTAAKSSASAKSSAATKSSAAKGNATSSSETPKKAAEESAQPQGEQKIINKDSLQDLELKLQSHVETLGKMVVPKLQSATAKKAQGKFVNELLQGLQLKLSLAECESIQKTSQEMVKLRKKQELDKAKRKADAEEEKKKKEAEAKGEVNDADFFADFM